MLNICQLQAITGLFVTWIGEPGTWWGLAPTMVYAFKCGYCFILCNLWSLCFLAWFVTLILCLGTVAGCQPGTEQSRLIKGPWSKCIITPHQDAHSWEEGDQPAWRKAPHCFGEIAGEASWGCWRWLFSAWLIWSLWITPQINGRWHIPGKHTTRLIPYTWSSSLNREQDFELQVAIVRCNIQQCEHCFRKTF